MFKKVLWATDGSEAADLALAHAKAFADQPGSELIAVHVEEFTIPGKGGGSLPVHANSDELKKKIEDQVAGLSKDGISARLEVTRTGPGGAAHMIAELAQSEDADVIVTSTRGHTALAGLLLGNVTQRLLHISPCPVFVVPSTKVARAASSSSA
jgi:nucleotide-binding universal stress UspA family protein